MVPVSTFEELEEHYKYVNHDNNQPYFFILLIKPYNISEYFDVSRDFFNDIKNFHIHSGKGCDFFMPGYANDLVGAIMNEKQLDYKRSMFDHRYLDRHHRNKNGSFYPVTMNNKEEYVFFNENAFNDFVKRIEEFSEGRWKYRRQAELVLVKKDKINNKLDYSDTLIFNLEDIVRQKCSVSNFIDIVIDLSFKYTDDKDIKRNIYLNYWDLSSPNDKNIDKAYDNHCNDIFNKWYNLNQHYVFISYSFKDRDIANKIRELLKSNGVHVWMAPNDLKGDVSYQYIIRKAIERADKFFLVYSKYSNDSVWVEKETTIAKEKLGHKKMMIYLYSDIVFEPRNSYKEVIFNDEVIRLNDNSSLRDEIQVMIENGDLIINK